MVAGVLLHVIRLHSVLAGALLMCLEIGCFVFYVVVTGALLCLPTGVLFCVGGRGADGDPFPSVECYNAHRDEWFFMADLNTRRRHVGVCSANGTTSLPLPIPPFSVSQHAFCSDSCLCVVLMDIHPDFLVFFYDFIIYN